LRESFCTRAATGAAGPRSAGMITHTPDAWHITRNGFILPTFVVAVIAVAAMFFIERMY
jgi:hypothetical protein